jgi:hypothetical protein
MKSHLASSSLYATRQKFSLTRGDEMTIVVHEKRFGVNAAEKRVMSKEQLFESLKIQVQEDLSGKPHPLIRIILIRLGYLTHEQAGASFPPMESRKAEVKMVGL